MKTNHYQTILKLLASTMAITLIVALMPSFASGQGMNDIQWLSSVERAKEIAKQQNKLVLLHFDAEWCRPCKALESYVFRAGAVKKAIAENVVPVRLDADKALAVVNEYDVSMVPFDVIITPSGRVVTERRSPADAENYAKMISSTSTASRILEKEKMGPIAHQRVVRNRAMMGQDSSPFQPEGPQIPEIGLSKDGSLLQRRQTAFSDESTAVRSSNPFVNGVSGESEPSPIQEEQTVSVEDLQRDQFLSRERNWVAPVEETRRAKPERIVNERYFEKFSDKTPPNVKAAVSSVYTPESGTPQLALASGTASVPVESQDVKHADMNSIELSLDDSSTAATLEVPDELVPPPLDGGDFSFELENLETTPEANPIVEVDRPEYMDVASAAQPAEDVSKFSLRGKCPVTLITEGRWQDGDTRWGIVHRNRTYIFANAQALALFRTNPDKYSPVLAGYDPVIYHEQGKLVDGLVENGVFMGNTPDQRVVLFLDQQTRARFQASPLYYLDSIRTATQNAGQGTIVR
jgi:thiol-disulfide isomerase/thioredoxin